MGDGIDPNGMEPGIPLPFHSEDFTYDYDSFEPVVGGVIADERSESPPAPQFLQPLAEPASERHPMWNRFNGAVETVAGAAEALAGAGLVFTGAATAETGVGILVAGTGWVVFTHGVDTATAGLTALATGEDADTLTSRALQLAGMEREDAELADIAIGMAGSLGAGGIMRAERIVATVPSLAEGGSATSVSLAYIPGHTKVGINRGAETEWSHLWYRMRRVGSGTAPIYSVQRTKMLEGYEIVTIPVAPSRAEAAAAAVDRVLGKAVKFDELANNCVVYTDGILREAGLLGLPLIKEPHVSYAVAWLQSPAGMSFIRSEAAGTALVAHSVHGSSSLSEQAEEDATANPLAGEMNVSGINW